MKRKFTAFFVAFTLLFSTALTSCLGSFSAFNGLKDWNQSVTDSKFVNNFLFWVLNIIPVYELFLAGDVLIFNLLEFWTGENPLAMRAGESQNQAMTLNGKNYIMTATKNKMSVADNSGTVISELVFDPEHQTWLVAEGDELRKLVTLTEVDGEMATYKLYKKECTEGQSYSVNVKELNHLYKAVIW